MFRNSMAGLLAGICCVAINTGFEAGAQTSNVPSEVDRAAPTGTARGDTQYCKALAGKYERYMPMRSYGESRGSSPSVETMVAMTMCEEDRSAEAIPILERSLAGAGYSLPPPATASRPE